MTKRKGRKRYDTYGIPQSDTWYKARIPELLKSLVKYMPAKDLATWLADTCAPLPNDTLRYCKMQLKLLELEGENNESTRPL